MQEAKMTKDEIVNYIKTLRSFLVIMLTNKAEIEEMISNINIKLNQLEAKL